MNEDHHHHHKEVINRKKMKTRNGNKNINNEK